MKRSSLDLAQVSPVLHALTSSTVLMPGVSSCNGSITIHGVDQHVTVLQSKTKPKKLSLIGSDGQRYVYLLKGREDLHLDERIMQLLDTVNQLLSASRSSNERQLRARHYAVLPLGDHSGLIQWVEHAQPVFALYKAWLKRQQQVPTSVRPIDMFSAKMVAALKARGINPSAPRREWPLDTLLTVIQQLMDETPGYVIIDTNLF